jgi:non-homologous end joining protein Ku
MQPLTSATSTGVNLSFGTINVAVSVHGAVGDPDTGLRTVCHHEHAPTPVKQKLACPLCGNDGTLDGFSKARDTGDGFVIIPPDVQEQARAAGTEFKKSMTLTAHPVEEVTAALMPSGKSYYLSLKSQVKGSLKAYHLLAEMVTSRPDLAFLTKLTLRTSTSVFQLAVAGEHTLVLRQMADADLVREHPVIAPVEISPAERALMTMAADTVVEPFMVDVHGTGKSHVVAEYAASQTPVAAGEVAAVAGAAAGGNVIDLTAALEAMIAAKGQSVVEAAQDQVKEAAGVITAPRRRRRKITESGKAVS